MNRKNLLLVAFALLLAALGNWLAELGVKQVDRRITPAPVTQLNYFLNGVTITAMDPDGNTQHRLQAERVEHFEESDTTRLHHPKLELYEQQQLAWRVEAQQGEVNPQADEVQLQGEVLLQQLATRGETVRLATTALQLQPKRGRAETDQPVTLTQGGNRIDAVGMEIEQKSRRLLLLSQVRGRYEKLAD